MFGYGVRVARSASWMRRQNLLGRSGNSLISMPNGLSASQTALVSAPGTGADYCPADK
jgi:hypothetical protein